MLMSWGTVTTVSMRPCKFFFQWINQIYNSVISYSIWVLIPEDYGTFPILWFSCSTYYIRAHIQSKWNSSPLASSSAGSPLPHWWTDFPSHHWTQQRSRRSACRRWSPTKYLIFFILRRLCVILLRNVGMNGIIYKNRNFRLSYWSNIEATKRWGRSPWILRIPRKSDLESILVPDHWNSADFLIHQHVQCVNQRSFVENLQNCYFISASGCDITSKVHCVDLTFELFSIFWIITHVFNIAPRAYSQISHSFTQELRLGQQCGL